MDCAIMRYSLYLIVSQLIQGGNYFMSNKNLAKTIDHTLLKADSRKEEVETLCKEAREYNFATVCVNPYWVKTASELLDGSDVGVTTVIGFPLGASTSAVKAAETRDAIKNGATEVDMVMNIGAFKSGEDRKST